MCCSVCQAMQIFPGSNCCTKCFTGNYLSNKMQCHQSFCSIDYERQTVLLCVFWTKPEHLSNQYITHIFISSKYMPSSWVYIYFTRWFLPNLEQRCIELIQKMNYTTIYIMPGRAMLGCQPTFDEKHHQTVATINILICCLTLIVATVWWCFSSNVG